jgi:nucleoside 2-deoxyribosyltransferase
MKIYFSCSITGGRADEKVYQLLVSEMLHSGIEVPTAQLSESGIVDLEKVVDPNEIFHRDMNWLKDCDAVVAEVSTPSHGVGYEIAIALTLGKPVLCCYRQGRTISKIITGNDSPNLMVKEYANEEEVISYLQEFVSSLK